MLLGSVDHANRNPPGWCLKMSRNSNVCIVPLIRLLQVVTCIWNTDFLSSKHLKRCNSPLLGHLKAKNRKSQWSGKGYMKIKFSTSLPTCRPYRICGLIGNPRLDFQPRYPSIKKTSPLLAFLKKEKSFWNFEKPFNEIRQWPRTRIGKSFTKNPTFMNRILKMNRGVGKKKKEEREKDKCVGKKLNRGID